MKYKTIVVDPPWKYGKWGKASTAAFLVSGIREETNKEIPLPYSSMSNDEISLLPIHNLADNDCELYLWTTQKYLPVAFGILKGWGFKYCETLIWCKEPRGTGQGGLFTPTAEFILHGRVGKMPHKKRIDTTWWKVTRPHNSHSTKPECFQDIIESVSDAPRLEMFARRQRDGWDVFGNEVEGSIEL